MSLPAFTPALRPQQLWRSVVHNPQLRDPAMWLVWLVPTFLVPTFRFVEDSQREVRDRVKLSVRDFVGYMGGVLVNFTLAPASYVLFEAKQATQKHARLLSTAVGALSAAAYSGLGANKFAHWFNQKFFKSPQTLHPGPYGDVFTQGAPPEATIKPILPHGAAPLLPDMQSSSMQHQIRMAHNRVSQIQPQHAWYEAADAPQLARQAYLAPRPMSTFSISQFK